MRFNISIKFQIFFLNYRELKISLLIVSIPYKHTVKSRYLKLDGTD